MTPHIIKTGEAAPPPSAVLPIPTPEALPTLPPGMSLPNASAHVPRAPTPISVPTAIASPLGVLALPTPAAVPAPTPTAFSSTNVFVYGSPPPNTYAADTEAPKIYYVQFAPTLLRNGTPVQISVVTSSNVRKVEVGYPGYMTTLTEIAASKWQGAYNFNGSGLASSQQTIMLQLNAYGQTGSAASIQIPVNLPDP